ncbi:DUF1295 domain-containing protein [Myxococcota bacterium]|nr:DUF1295 domain-containing protein [Myxococcota bacterium]
MSYDTLQSIGRIALILTLGATLSWLGSQGGAVVMGTPLFALCGALAFGLNWAVFVPSFLFQVEHYFDLTGSLTYLMIVACALFLNPITDARSLLLGGMIAIWAIRLGSFLFFRIQRSGGDGRFDSLKTHLGRFLMTWTLQALWVLFTAACALAAMTSTKTTPLGAWAIVGSIVFIAGFVIEIVADRQKSAFRSNPAHRDRFIESGLWAWSRHPNYFGEIVLWLGIACVAFPALSGWQYATLVSPIFVFVLLSRISGVPLLEARGKKKWGHEPEYRAYLDRTPTLFPRRPRPSS